MDAEQAIIMLRDIARLMELDDEGKPVVLFRHHITLLRQLADGLETLDHHGAYDGPVMDYRWALSVLLGEEEADDER